MIGLSIDSLMRIHLLFSCLIHLKYTNQCKWKALIKLQYIRNDGQQT
jgi:hypothetical protein